MSKVKESDQNETLHDLKGKNYNGRCYSQLPDGSEEVDLFSVQLLQLLPIDHDIGIIPSLNGGLERYQLPALHVYRVFVLYGLLQITCTIQVYKKNKQKKNTSVSFTHTNHQKHQLILNVI